MLDVCGVVGARMDAHHRGDSCIVKVARDSCDVTHILTQASIPTRYVHGSKSCTKYSLHFVHVQSTSRHTYVIMLYAIKCSLYIVGQF